MSRISRYRRRHNVSRKYRIRKLRKGELYKLGYWANHPVYINGLGDLLQKNQEGQFEYFLPKEALGLWARLVRWVRR